MAAISLTIVPAYAAVLGILYLALTFAVIRPDPRFRRRPDGPLVRPAV